MGYTTSSVSLSVDKHQLAYADDVSRRETAARGRKVSRSEVFRWAVALLKFFRHDWATPINSLSLTAQALRAGAVTRGEAADQIDRVVAEVQEQRARVINVPQARGTD